MGRAGCRGWACLVVAAGTTLVDVARLHPYEYAYFNRSFGGLPAAAGRFETDYWGVAYKEGFEWLVNESHASGNRADDRLFLQREFQPTSASTTVWSGRARATVSLLCRRK